MSCFKLSDLELRKTSFSPMFAVVEHLHEKKPLWVNLLKVGNYVSTWSAWAETL